VLRLLFLAAVATQSPAPNAPTQPPVEATAPAPAAKPEKPKLICVKQEVMGSLFPVRTCATEAQWNAYHKREADRKDRVRDIMSTNSQ
jgi:hypothetical protein